MMAKPEIRKLENDLNKMFSIPQFQALLPRSPNMRYFQVKKDNYAFAWTTEPCLEKGKKRFYATAYRIHKDGSWKLKRKVAFGRRCVAKARAKKWFEQRKTSIQSISKREDEK